MTRILAEERVDRVCPLNEGRPLGICLQSVGRCPDTCPMRDAWVGPPAVMENPTAQPAPICCCVRVNGQRYNSVVCPVHSGPSDEAKRILGGGHWRPLG